MQATIATTTATGVKNVRMLNLHPAAVFVILDTESRCRRVTRSSVPTRRSGQPDLRSGEFPIRDPNGARSRRCAVGSDSAPVARGFRGAGVQRNGDRAVHRLETAEHT